MTLLPTRLWALDAARGVAVCAMVAYHFCWDLLTLGFADIPMFTHGFWMVARVVIPSAFLWIMGVSLVLAHRQGVNWSRIARRLGMIGGAALLVTLGSYLAFGPTYIFFGVLHCIAMMSLLALPSVRWPWPVSLLIGLGAVLLPFYWQHPFFDQRWLLWVGLGTYFPNTNDYVPLLPWGGVVLIGVAAGKYMVDWQGASTQRAPTPPVLPPPVLRPLIWCGRHALAVYLIHQPVLFGALLGLSWLLANVR